MGESSVYETLRRLKERTDVDKPLNPHALRHNFVTIALRRGVPESAIKHQMGHAPDSRVMESTYSHLKDSDYIREAREAFDLETKEIESELTPEVCPKCGENTPENAKLCPWCGLEFTPEARAAQEQVQDDLKEDYRDMDPEDAETDELLEAFDELLDDHPEVRAELVEYIKE